MRIIYSTQRIWSKKLSFFDVSSVYFIEFPAMAVCVKTPSVLNGFVNCAHVLQTPETCTDYLLDWVSFNCNRPTLRHLFNWKEDWDKWEPNSLIVVAMVFQVFNAQMISSVSLVKKTIKLTMELADMAGLSLKVKTDIKSRVSRSFN